MKFTTTLALSILFLACAPSDPSVPASGAPGKSGVEDPHDREPVAGREPSGALEAMATQTEFATGQTLYIPVYSHVYWGSDRAHFNLACTLSIRNIDPKSSITVTAVDYFDTKGEMVRAFLSEPRILDPLETADYYIKERDISGGSGANFIVRWGASTDVNPPIVESVMIGVDAGQGISFVCPAREITE